MMIHLINHETLLSSKAPFIYLVSHSITIQAKLLVFFLEK